MNVYLDDIIFVIILLLLISFVNLCYIVMDYIKTITYMLNMLK